MMIFSKKILVLFTLLISSIIIYHIFNPMIDGVLYSLILELISNSTTYPVNTSSLELTTSIIVTGIKTFALFLAFAIFHRLYLFMIDETPSQPEYTAVDGSQILRSGK